VKLEVVEGGPLTTVQDVPGRVGYWHVGVPPNGPMDTLAHRLVNRVLGNSSDAAALELTGAGLTCTFTEDATVAIGGADMGLTVDGEPAAPYTPVAAPAGAVVKVGGIAGAGVRASFGVRGGIDTPRFLDSRATFTLGVYGGHHGRPLRAGDVVDVGDDIEADAAPLAPGVAPRIGRTWELGVLIGPHTAPEFLTADGLAELLGATWTVHFNSARTGIRLVGPKPRWARGDGGDAGLHPSNIHDTGYAIGAVDLTGDMPVILGPDGPSLGGFVCPAVVAAAERWKLGQLAADDEVRLVPWSPRRAAQAAEQLERWVDRATDAVHPVARPKWNRLASAPLHLPAPAVVLAEDLGDGVLRRDAAVGERPEVTYRRAGDRFLLVEFGPMALDLELRLRVHALERWVTTELGGPDGGIVDATAGVRSLLVQVDGRKRTVESVAAAIAGAQDELDQVAAEPFTTRVVHLPLSWDDPATRLAIERYMHGVRPDAPWCPWNIEFIRRVNGLETVDDVHRVVFDASYLVLGLGDVYLGAPVATPLDPRHRLVTTKYNPARTWTPENAVGIGGAYLCIYGMEGPGGYQFVGRTVQVWNQHRRGPHFAEPWLLRTFDELRWMPVGAEELMEMRDAQAAGELELRIEEHRFDIVEHRRFLAAEADSIDAFRRTQQAAFAAERAAWEASGELSGGPT